MFYHLFCPLFVKFWFKSCEIGGEEKYKPACLVITFNSRLHDMASIERYGQSNIAFIRDVAYA